MAGREGIKNGVKKKGSGEKDGGRERERGKKKEKTSQFFCIHYTLI